MSLSTESPQAGESYPFPWSTLSRIFVALVMLGMVPPMIAEVTGPMLNHGTADILASGGMIMGFLPALMFLLRGRKGVRCLPALVCGTLLFILACSAAYFIFLAPDPTIHWFWALALIAMVVVVSLERFVAADPNTGAGSDVAAVNETTSLAAARKVNHLETLSSVLLGCQAGFVGFALVGIFLLVSTTVPMSMSAKEDVPVGFWLFILGNLGAGAGLVPGAAFLFKGRKRLAATSWAWTLVGAVSLALMVGVSTMVSNGLAMMLGVFLAPFFCHLIAERWYSAKAYR